MSVETLLEVEIEDKFEKLAGLEFATKEYALGTDSLIKLVDRAIEIEKLKASEAQAETQMREDHKSRVWKNVIDAGEIVLPLIVTGVGAYFSFKFEETGTITSTTGRQFMQRLFKK